MTKVAQIAALFHRRRHGRGRDAGLRAGRSARPVCYAGRPGTGGDCRYAAGDAGAHDGAGPCRRPPSPPRPATTLGPSPTASGPTPPPSAEYHTPPTGRRPIRRPGQYTDAATAAADVAAYGNANTNANRTPAATDTPAPSEIRPLRRGTGVGETPPDFAMQLADGMAITSQDLVGRRPAGFYDVLCHLVTNLPRRVADACSHPDRLRRPGRFLPGVLQRNAAALEGYIAENQYVNMTAVQPVGAMLRDLAIVSQSSMLAMDSGGVITFRKGYGRPRRRRGDFARGV